VSSSGPCVKQRVVCIITSRFGTFVGENDCAHPQQECPRQDLPTGTGYSLCREVCGQTSHAEVAAVKAAGDKAEGGIAYLFGHSYCCDDCLKTLKDAGVRRVYIPLAPANYPLGETWAPKEYWLI